VTIQSIIVNVKTIVLQNYVSYLITASAGDLSNDLKQACSKIKNQTRHGGFSFGVTQLVFTISIQPGYGDCFYSS